jgi:DNA-binding winged helix-turn-helix (wHTH) protein
MDTSAPFRLADWLVEPSLNCISRDGTTLKVDGRHMRVLLLLAKHAGEIVSVQQIEDEVWRNEVVTQNSIHQAIAKGRFQKDPECSAKVMTGLPAIARPTRIRPESCKSA